MAVITMEPGDGVEDRRLGQVHIAQVPLGGGLVRVTTTSLTLASLTLLYKSNVFLGLSVLWLLLILMVLLLLLLLGALPRWQDCHDRRVPPSPLWL